MKKSKYSDAQIMSILKQAELSTAEGVPVLPIHDGFIVQDESEEFLRDAMDQVWFDRFGTRIGIA